MQGFFLGGGGAGRTYVPTVWGDESVVEEDWAVDGRRRGPWRRFETPESLEKDELALAHFEAILEELACLLVELDRENILRRRCSSLSLTFAMQIWAGDGAVVNWWV